MIINESLQYTSPALMNMVRGINAENPGLIQSSSTQIEGFIQNPTPILKRLEPHEVIHVADTALGLTQDVILPNTIQVREQIGSFGVHAFSTNDEKAYFCSEVGELIWSLKQAIKKIFKIEDQFKVLLTDSGTDSLDKMEQMAIDFLMGRSSFPDFKGRFGVYDLPDPKELAHLRKQKTHTQLFLTESSLAVVQALPFNGNTIAAFI